MMTTDAPTATESFAARLASHEADLDLDPAALTARVGQKLLGAGSRAELRSLLAGELYLQLHARNPQLDELPTTGHQDLASELISRIRELVIWQAPDRAPEERLFTVNERAHRVAEFDGVKVLVPARDIVRHQHEDTLMVAMPSWRTRTTPGYLLSLGGAGLPAAEQITRYYLAADCASRVLDLWPELLDLLATTTDGHQAKALSSTLAYPRSDALVIYIPARQREAVEAGLRELRSRHEPPRCPTSLFARQLAPGLAQAGEPLDPRPGYQQLSFGQHRSRVLADALFHARDHQLDLGQAWQIQARMAGIDPLQPAGNLPAG